MIHDFYHSMLGAYLGMVYNIHWHTFEGLCRRGPGWIDQDPCWNTTAKMTLSHATKYSRLFLGPQEVHITNELVVRCLY
jgi:hypothetical protein